ncbi:MAG: tetratricopeptide repeat protein [Bacteroidales bacterium]|jgi:tetratricopeptide (TPR) repeat protein|nr:tetratricopeptide repeat protein [Bacteroidales bacterium]MDD4830025.1 tetratricopeptide repeat protein [Bacteroidales bacterium]
MKRLLILIVVLTMPFVCLAQTPKSSTQKAKTSTQTKAKPKAKTSTKTSTKKAKPLIPKATQDTTNLNSNKTSNNCITAQEKLVQAHLQIENKQHWVAEELLKEALVLCPSEEMKYKYELAWNYYLMKEFQKAINILEPITKQSDCPSDVYQLLGNSYDEAANEPMAIVTYDKGFERYPNAGCLFLERGNIAYKRSNFIGALFYYEKGIEQDPSFASNYYRASQIFLSSSEEVWGMMYGEIFMNLERGSTRAKEISSKLYNTYHSEITFNVNQISVNFNDPTIVYSDSKTRPNLFPENYENALLKACYGKKNITLSSLIDIRKRFIQIFYKESPTFRNVLFDYHKQLIDLGFFEPYNYWLFGYGNTNEAGIWISQNKALFDRFMAWFNENPFPINKDNVFSRYKME